MSSRKRSVRTPAEQRRYQLDRLMVAMDRCAVCRGEAQWTNGYRAAKGLTVGSPEELRLYGKEMQQWKAVGTEEAKFRRLAQRLLRESRP